MKKIIYSLMVTGLLVSCKNAKKDAQAIADFKCISFENEDSTKIKGFEKNINDIESKYEGADLAQLIKISDSLFNKNCTAKIEHEKKLKELEKENKEFLESARNGLYEDASNELDKLKDQAEADAYINETNKMMDDLNKENPFEN